MNTGTIILSTAVLACLLSSGIASGQELLVGLVDVCTGERTEHNGMTVIATCKPPSPVEFENRSETRAQTQSPWTSATPRR